MKKKNQRLSYKHRIYPNKTQIKILNEDIFAGNQVFNITLNILKKEYDEYCGLRSFIQDFERHIQKKKKYPGKSPSIG